MRHLLLIGTIALAQAGAQAQFGVHRPFAPDGSVPWYVHAADLDGDDDQDVLGAFVTDGKFCWYTNDGSGQFTGPVVINAQAQYAKWVTSQDLDNDGAIDVIIAYGSPATFAWHRNLGGGVFGPEQLIATATDIAYALEIADIDGDGQADIVTASGNGLHWYAHDGSGQNWVDHLVSSISTLSDISAGDIDGDGNMDLLLSGGGSTGTVRWARNLGAGVFGPIQVISTGTANGIDITAADIDGDGDLDAVFVTNWTDRLAWQENLGEGAFGPVTAISTAMSLPTSLEAADMNGDGLKDLLVTVKWHNKVLYFQNAGGGVFLPSVDLAIDAFGAMLVTSADIDGDGLLDALYCTESDHGIAWCGQQAPGTFAPRQSIAWGVDTPIKVALADVDGDGAQDAITASWADGRVAIFHGNGIGQLGTVVEAVQGPRAPVALLPVDMNGDGAPDLMAGHYFGSIGWYANDGSGGFGPLQVINATDTVLRSMGLVDINGDGELDILCASQLGPGRISWYAGSGGGAFGSQQTIHLANGNLTAEGADMDGDGDVDVVCTALPSDLFWFANDGAGGFGPRIDLASHLNQGYQMELRDIDGDLDIDIIAVRQPVIVFDGGGPVDPLPRVVWYPNNGDGTFEPLREVADFSSSAAMHVVDIDSDGDLDALFSTTNAQGYVSCYLNDGLGNFGPEIVLPPTGYSVSTLSSGDLDGDGDPDVFTTESQSDRMGWYENYFGSPYRIRGRIFLDLDGDGSYTPGDTTGSFLSVAMSPQLSLALTDDDGNYEFYTNAGAYSVNSTAPSALWQLTTGTSSYAVSLTALDPVSSGNDFGYAPVTDVSNIAPSLTISNGPCNSLVPLWIDFSNQGTRVEHGIVRLDLDPLYTFMSAMPAPDSIVGNSYYWSFEDLYYFGSSAITAIVRLPNFMSMGSSLNSQLTVMRMDGNGAVTDAFAASWDQVLTCAYDPNDKLVDPKGYGVHGALPIDQDRLTYTIRFQNTGTATAHNVMVRDQLNARLDWNSLEVIAASHPLTRAGVEPDGEAVFQFDQIMLPDSNANELASHGFIKFRIAILPGQSHLSTITNEAAIFFDFNPPVITNTVLNTLIDCNLWAPEITEQDGDLLEAPPGDSYQWYFDGVAIEGATMQQILIGGTGFYSVRVMSEHGCSATSPEVQVIVTDAQDIHAIRASVIPNPFSSAARIVFSAPIPQDHVIEVVDVNGRVAQSRRGNGTQELLLGRNGLSPGLYVLRVQGPKSYVGAVRVVVE